MILQVQILILCSREMIGKRKREKRKEKERVREGGGGREREREGINESDANLLT